MKLFFKSALTAIAAFTLAVSAAEKHFPYMHGCVDSDAAKIDIRTLLGVEQMNAVDTEEKIVSGDIKVNSAVVRLEGKNYQMNLNGIVLPVDTIQNLAGDTVRFFIWMKGENIGAKGFHWTGAPAVGITLYDDYGNVVTRSESEFKTRGTFPWHCYYVDITFPRTISLTNEAYNEAVKPVSDDAAMIKELLGSNSTGRNKPGLYITLTNFGGGKVWFGGISYTKIGKAGEHAANWKDKTYGTMAPNPEYDELPVIMFNGLSADNQWNFLNGNKAFGSIKTIAGLTKYLNENGDDWFHQQKAIAKLPYLFVTARELNLGSGFEDKWMNTLKEYLVSKQDEETGLWKSNGVPNILSSAAIAAGCFSPRSQRRSDSEMIPTPWSALANDSFLPNAEKVIDTLLNCRVPGTAAWNAFALQPEKITSGQNLKRTDLTITAAAVKLLAIAAESLPADNQARINAQEAIRDALNYALTVFVKNSPKLTWSADNESIQSAENGVGLLEIIETSRWLEHRKNLNVAKPEMEVRDVTLDRPAKELLWKNTAEASITSVRIYCVTSDVAPQYITHKNLVGIISRDKVTVRNQDSIVAVRKILSAARREWGITPTSANAHYIEAKLKEVEQFAVGTASKKIRVTTPNTDAFAVVEGEEQKEFKFYAAAVNNYGELSDFVALEEAPAEAELELTDDLGAQF